MFVVGLEFRMDIVHRRMRSAMAVSIAGMVTPFVLGAGLGWFFYHHTSLFPEKTSLVEAMLFLGASMCITAFPMLARIIHFKRLTGRPWGRSRLGQAHSTTPRPGAWSPWCWPALTTTGPMPGSHLSSR